MIVIVLLEIDLHPVDLTRELVMAIAVVGRYRRTGFLADVAGFIEGEGHRHGDVDPPFTRRFAVDEEMNDAALAQAAAIVLELHPELVLAGSDRGGALGEESLDAEEVVTVLQPPVLRVQAPAADAAALRDDDAFGRLGADFDFSGNRVRLVLDVEGGRFGEPPHAAEENLRAAG